MASTSALSALSRPSSRTSKAMVRKSDAWTSITRPFSSRSVPIGEQDRRFIADCILVRHGSLAAGAEVRDGEDHRDQQQRYPLVDLEVQVSGRVEVLHQQLDADPRDDHEGAVHDRRIAA